jgi:hypothetical protein
MAHSISQGVSFSKFEQLDSDEDILEVVEISNVKRVVPARVAKHKELLRLAQEQAKKRRIEDQDYIAYRIAEQKRKKQLRREAKLAKEADETQNNDISPLKSLKKLVKVIVILLNIRNQMNYRIKAWKYKCPKLTFMIFLKIKRSMQK